MKSTRSWSEVVSRGCLAACGELAPSTSRHETPTKTLAKGKISENGKSGKVIFLLVYVSNLLEFIFSR